MESNRRKLNDLEKNKIFEICESYIHQYSFWNKIKLIIPICLILLLIFNYKTIVWENMWIFLLFSIVMYIFWIVVVTLKFEMFNKIEKDKYECLESKLIKSRELRNSNALDSRRFFMVTVNIDGNVKEFEYRGNNFDNLKVGENIIVIHYKNIFKLDAYIGFIYNELNN